MAKDCYYRDSGRGKGKDKGGRKGKGSGKQANTEKFAGKCNYC